jgi:hypothetical protein
MRPCEMPLAAIDKHYTGTAYLGVASSELGVSRAQRSVERITRRPGDGEPVFAEFTKGQDAREWLISRFLASEHDFLLFLDGDEEYPPDLLERLRSHKLPCVAALYYRRTLTPHLLPIWYEWEGESEVEGEIVWPMMPFRAVPEPGRLYRLAATGYGGWLIHREVFEAVRPLLRGERFILEDDMDVWPYDLGRVLQRQAATCELVGWLRAVLNGGGPLSAEQVAQAEALIAEVEAGEELRLLRGRKTTVGSDLRLGFYIRQAGYTIWGDAGAACGHYVVHPVGQAERRRYGPAFDAEFAAGTTNDIEALRRQHQEALRGLIPSGEGSR